MQKTDNPNTGSRTLRYLLPLLVALVSTGTLAQTTYLVNATTDNSDANPGNGECNTGSGDGFAECTLRAAIEEANASSGVANIHFAADIPTNALDFTEISISSGLPAITGPVNIDGRTHPDWDGSTEFPQPRVVLRWTGGSGTAWSAIRLDAGAAGSSVRGLAIRDFTASGFRIAGGSGFDIMDNVIGGVWVPGLTLSAGNDRHGIDFNGGSSAANASVVSNNVIFANGEHGILLRNGFASGLISNNVIGLLPPFPGDTEFQPSAGNGGDGIRIQDDAGSDNRIGSLFSTPGNVLANNSGRGLTVRADGQVIVGNWIGLPFEGGTSSGSNLADYGNGDDAVVLESSNNQFGGTNDGEENVTGNSGAAALRIGNENTPTISANDNVIRNNNFGVSLQGENAGTTWGIRVENGSNNWIDQVRVGFNDTGISVRPGASSTSVTGSTIHDNSLHGIRFSSDGSFGGAAQGAGNELFDNGLFGVLVEDGAGQVSIQNNWIGTDVDGNNRDNSIGVAVLGSNTVDIGTAGNGNVIGNNGFAGIVLSSGASEAWVRGNFIGALPGSGFLVGDPVGNGVGVLFESSDTVLNRVGRGPTEAIDPTTWFPTMDSGNVIAFNETAGIQLSGANDSVLFNTFRGNLFFASAQPIDLGMDELDIGGADQGPNTLLNPPDFDADQTQVNLEDGSVTVRYRVQTVATNADYPLRLDFYLRQPIPDQNPFKTFIGSVEYSDQVDFEFQTETFDLPEIFQLEGSSITAMSTDASGNSSQFAFDPVPLSQTDGLFQDRFEQP